MTNLGNLGGDSDAVAINDRDQIVGSIAKNGQQHAVLWTLKLGS